MLKKIAKNTAYLTIGRYTGEGLNFILFIALSRIYGGEDIGKYGFALAIAAVLGSVLDFGFADYAVKVFARERDRGKLLLSNFIIIRIVLSIIVTMILVGIAFILDIPDSTRGIILMIGIYQLLFVFGQVYIAEIKAHEEMIYIAKLELIHRGTIFLLAIGLMMMQYPFQVIMLAYPIGGLFYLLGCIYISQSRYGHMPWVFDINEIKKSMHEAGYFFFAQLFFQLYFRSGVFFLMILVSEEAAGAFTMASKLIISLCLLTYFFSSAIYPAMSRAFHEEGDQFSLLYRKSLQGLLIGIIPIAVGIAFYSAQISSLVYGANISGVSQLLGVLSVYFILASVNTFLQYVLFSMDQHRRITTFLAYAAGINILSVLILVNRFGLLGAAYASIITESFICLTFVLFLSKITRASFVTMHVTKPVLAASGGILSLFLLHGISDLLALLTSIVVYALGLFVLKAISLEDLSHLRQLIPRKSGV